MLYTRVRPHLVAEIRDTSGKVISQEPLDVTLPAMVSHGTVPPIPFTVHLPHVPGTYSVLITATYFDRWPPVSPVTVRVLDPTAQPNLILHGTMLTGPALYAPGERVALWATLKDGRTTPLQDTQARPDGTISVTLARVPPDTAEIVAHGTTSNVELWVNP